VFSHVLQAGPIGPSGFPRLWEITDGGNDSMRGQRYSSGSYRSNVIDNNVTQAAFDTLPAVALGSSGRFAFVYGLNDIAACANGGTVATDGAATLPTVDRMVIGDSSFTSAGVTVLNAPISRLTYWPQRLPNATLQALTA
jgi:hypothetical protein